MDQLSIQEQSALKSALTVMVKQLRDNDSPFMAEMATSARTALRKINTAGVIIFGSNVVTVASDLNDIITASEVKG